MWRINVWTKSGVFLALFMLGSGCSRVSTVSTVTSGLNSATSLEGNGSVNAPDSFVSSWKVSDSFQYTANQPSLALSVSSDNAGNVFVAGQGRDTNNTSHVILRKSQNAGAWSTVLDYQYVAGKDSLLLSSVGSDGNLYLVGSGNDASNVPHWLVRRSSDGGATFTNLNDYSYVSGKVTSAKAIAVDSGVLYVAGYGYDTNFKLHWIIRKSTDGGTTWSNVDDYQYVSGNDSAPANIKILSQGKILVTGYGTDSSGTNPVWIVRESTDSGTTWQNKDVFSYASGKSSVASGIVIGAGNLGVAGAGMDTYTTSAFHWLTRMSSDGINWETTDNFQYSLGYNSIAQGMGKDPAGHIYVVGFGTDNHGQDHWVARISADGGATWKMSDDYNYASAQPSRPFDTSSDLAGRIYSVGSGIDSSGISHWIVRQL